MALYAEDGYLKSLNLHLGGSSFLKHSVLIAFECLMPPKFLIFFILYSGCVHNILCSSNLICSGNICITIQPPL